MYIKSDTIEKSLAIIAFSFIIFSLIIILITPSAVIYEISIYNVYPWYFWFFILTAIFLGQLIIFKNVFYGESEKKYNGWLLGLIPILVPIIILILLPIIRGYPTYNTGDHFFQIGEIKDIIQFGNIGQDVFYPNLHILTASLILITGDSIINFVNFIPRFFFFLLPITMYLFYRIIFKNKNEMKIALLLGGSFLFFGTWFMDLFPFYQSFSLMPIIVYLYFKREKLKDTISFSLMFIIIVTSFIFYHPLNSLFLIFIFLFLAIIFYLPQKIKFLKLTEVPEKLLKEKSLNIVFFSILLFFIWYFSFSSIVGYFYKVSRSIFFGPTGSIFQSEIAIFNSYSPSILDTIKVIAYTYGSFLIVGLLSVFALTYIFIKWFRNKGNIYIRFCFIFSGIIFLFFSILSAGAIFSDFIVDLPRFMTWLTIFSIILIVIICYSLLSGFEQTNIIYKPFKKLVITIAMCTFFISITYLSLFTFYPSPIIGSGYVNPQVTKMEWKGSEWFQEHNDKQILTNEIGITIWRYYYAIYGLKKSQIILPTGEGSKPPPDHFSYNNKTFLGESFNESRYLIITYLGRIRYPESYPNYRNLWRFTPDDFDQLQNDNTVNRFYDNGGFETYLVRSSKT